MNLENWGTDGKGNNAELVTLTNGGGTQVKVSSLGATVVSFLFRDKDGVMRDVVLGYDGPADYLKNKSLYFGASVGRCANRVAGASVTIGGKEYALEANSDGNNLHSGSNGVSHKIWKTERLNEAENKVVFAIESGHLEQGFPGNMKIKASYSLTEDDCLRITYEAVSDQDTVANFTNHSYFNLAGHDGGDIGRQKMKIHAKAFTPSSRNSIPTGEIRPVAGTPFDFRESKEIGKEIDSDYEQLEYAGGYDHNFVLDYDGQTRLAAEAVCEETGICLLAYTDRPGVHFYAGNFIYGHTGKGGVSYGRRHGFCLETQHFPNAVNTPGFLPPFLKAGEPYRAMTAFALKRTD